jgi:arylsulfatase A-like enzyme
MFERAGDWLANRERGNTFDPANPWFCVVSVEPPHPPYDSPAANITPRDPANLQLRENVPTNKRVMEKARAELSGYYAHIEATDRAMGRLLDRIDPSSTAVFFSSVHGDMHGSHGLFRKGWPHEESIRIPLITSVPNGEKLADDSPVSLIDLPSMTLAVAKGRPWSPAADHVAISMPSVVELPYQCDRAWNGRRTRDWKVVFNSDGSPWLVFNLRDDPAELENLAGSDSVREIVRWARETT